MTLFYAAVKSLESFLKPLYQDLDGISRFDDVERIGAVARRLAAPTRELELLILFHALPGWLDKVGNLSRTLLACDVTEGELRQTAASLKRLDRPETDAERVVASAIAIDNAGVYGLARQLARVAGREDDCRGGCGDRQSAGVDERRGAQDVRGAGGEEGGDVWRDSPGMQNALNWSTTG